MKKKLPTHDDTPSKPLEPKIIESEAPNYEGDVRGTKYEIDEDRPLAQPLTAPTSKSVDRAYPIPDDDVDKYAVDTRIWDRMNELLDGSGGDAGPHTHNNYALKEHEHDYLTELPTHDHPHGHDEYSPKSHLHPEYAGKVHDHPHDHDEYADAQALADHLANHPSGGDGGGYDDTALKGRVSQNETDISNLKVENNSQNQKIQANSTAIDGKASTSHLHPEHAPVVHGHSDLATKEELTQGLATKSPTTHTHPAPTGFWGMWKGTQAEFDALETKSDKTLYVVI